MSIGTTQRSVHVAVILDVFTVPPNNNSKPPMSRCVWGVAAALFLQGFVKIGDFGFAKVLDSNNRTYTFCGTPGYVAPENGVW